MCDGGVGWLVGYVVLLYILASSVSFATILLYRCTHMCSSILVLKTIFLFGKCVPAICGKYTLLQVPKRFFIHFYVTAAVVSLLTIFVAVCGRCSSIATNAALMAMLCQALKRLYENLFVHVFSGSKMSMAHYFIGHIFYLTMSPCIYWSSRFTDERGMVSVIVYMFLALLIMTLQHLVMRQLAHTRICANKEKQNAYLVPRGYMFAHVTCPHFSLEIALYLLTHAFLGLHLMPFTAVLLFVLSNQLCSGVINHFWYLEHFPEFAQSRKILIPFIF
ncbi:Polyprenol reductase [Taenia crassiceps]|uniref:Polyprenal reductase n=1 Tax=Taenia crassiceps TaxID=6207 RepID=A0ABR4Q177_9CEST